MIELCCELEEDNERNQTLSSSGTLPVSDVFRARLILAQG